MLKQLGFFERRALAGLWALVLAPVVAHGVWRPVGALGGAGAVTLAALAVAVAVVVADALWPARLTRRLVAGGGMAAVGAAFCGAWVPALLALTAVAVFASLMVPRWMAWAPRRLDGQARGHRWRVVAVGVVGLLAVVQTARLSTFMGDPERTDLAVSRGLAPHLTLHACSTAYFQAARLADAGVADLYAEDWWPSYTGSPTGRAEGERYAPFELDAYLYPPPFLLLPRLVGGVGDDFATLRAVWFALNALSVALGLWAVVAVLSQAAPRTATWALLLMPLIWLAFPVLITLQVGNVHLAVMALAVLGMLAFHRDRPVLGGALLAFAILAKISPGLLGIVLLMQRRWRAIGWTVGFGVAYTALSLALFGWGPFEAFSITLLPRLSSGRAFDFFATRTSEIIINAAPFGIPFKLQALGVAVGDVWATAGRIGAAFNVVVVGLAAVAGWRARPLDRSAPPPVATWLALLTLGGLSSPFAPSYVGFTAFWLLTLWAAEIRRPRHVVLWGLAYLGVLGPPPVPTTAVLVISLVGQLVTLGWVVWLIVRRPPPVAVL